MCYSNIAEREIYKYGFRQGLALILNIITSLIIGCLLNCIWLCFVFLAAYITLRRYAGGYHARTQMKCYLFSIPFITISLLAVEHLPQTGSMILEGAAMAGIIIFLLAPVEDENKPLDQAEKKVFRIRARKILVSEEALVLLFYGLGFYEMALCITVALAATGGMVVLGEVKNVK